MTSNMLQVHKWQTGRSQANILNYSAEMAGETTKEDPNGQEHVESVFCQGAGCMIGLVIVLVAAPAAILVGSLAICWWCERKR